MKQLQSQCTALKTHGYSLSRLYSTCHDIASCCETSVRGNWWQCSWNVTSFSLDKHWVAYLYLWSSAETTLEITNGEHYFNMCWEQIEQMGNYLRFWCGNILNRWKQFNESWTFFFLGGKSFKWETFKRQCIYLSCGKILVLNCSGFWDGKTF